MDVRIWNYCRTTYNQNIIHIRGKIYAHVKALQTGTAVAPSLTDLFYALRFFQLNVPEDKSILNLPERGQTDPNPVSTEFFSYTSVKKNSFNLNKTHVKYVTHLAE